MSTGIALGGILGSGWAVAAGYGVMVVRAWAGDEVLRAMLWTREGAPRVRYWREWSLSMPSPYAY